MTAELTEQIQRLSTDQKLELIEVIWNDLAQKPAEIPIPDWHLAELASREKELAAGAVQWLDFEECVREWQARRG